MNIATMISTVGIPVASGCNKVEEGVDTVVTEARVTLDPGFFGQDIVVLAFKISEDLLEAKECICVTRVFSVRLCQTPCHPRLSSGH